MTIVLDGAKIGRGHPPYVVAELSANHNGSLERALQLIEVAAQAGANAVKLQTYRADTMTIECDAEDFKISGGLWAGKTLYELYEWAHTPWEWHKPLFERARDLGLTVFSSPFDLSAVDFLEELKAPAYKIASFELVDLELIRRVAATGKPVILSTGLATRDEIGEAVEAVRSVCAGRPPLILLHCVSSYPAAAADYHLKTMSDMARHFQVHVGLSDHTLESTTAVAAVALGACMVEKHFTLNRSDGGPDDSFSLEPEDLKALCRSLKTAHEALGNVNYGLKGGEKETSVFRRSLYAVQDIRAGDAFTRDNTRNIRPGHGLAPKHLDRVLGKKAVCDISRGTPLDKSMIQKFEEPA